ncbi:BEN domain-containing protein 3-like [Apteryx mantelli]|uniref:BEN domain-containing protein 3-like n=1 Tax=Apteryx mantelli TaxID=2696672 RepID=A0ABM4FGH8_9AVES
MNSAEITDDDEVEIPRKDIVKVETENEDEALDFSVTSRSSEEHSLDGAVACLQESNKRKQTSLGCDGSGSQQDVLPSVKKRRFAQEGPHSNLKNRDTGSPTQVNTEQPNENKNPNTARLCEEEPFSDISTPSYKKPLYGISHKITEKKNPPGTEQFASYDLFEKISPSSPSHLQTLNDQRTRDSAATIAVTAATTDSDPNLYSLIPKMFYTLNTLSSSVTQLHSKVDLLSLEVSRIKKQVSPAESVAEFKPPPEYRLTSAELKQMMDQSTSGGDLACRLLVQLFPELFNNDEFNRNCSACSFLNRRKLDSLHLQLIRNYVEVCYPSVKNTAVWHVECLPQVNDFFHRFWAKREMENSQQNVQSSSFYETEQVESSHFIEDKEQERISDCSGACNKKQLDPIGLRLIHHYVEAVYPVEKKEEVWRYECIPSIDERCQRSNRKKCDVLKAAKKARK